MKHETASQVRGHGITKRAMARVAATDAGFGLRLKSYRFWSMALILFVVAACGGGGGSGSSNDADAPLTVESVSLNRDTLLLETTEEASITATLHLSNGETASRDSDVNWFVGSKSFATIDRETGTTATVKAGNDVGRTTVTAESGGHKATADIYVSENVALQVRPSAIFLPPECSEPATARLITDQGVTQDVTRDATWSVSNTDAIAVATGNSSAGLVDARTPSAVPVATVVRASYSGRRATARATVADLASIALFDSGSGTETDVTGGNIDIAQYESRRLKADGAFEQNVDFPEFPDRDITDCVAWTSSNQSVATVSDEGVVTGVAQGESANVTASHGNSPSAAVTVNVSHLMEGFSINPSGSITLPEGAREQLQALADIDDGSTSNITTAVDWNSDDPRSATVGNETGRRGLVTGVAPGQAVVTAALSGFNDESVFVEVESSPDAPGGLSVRAEPNVLLAGDSTDTSKICTTLISSRSSEPIPDTDIGFSLDEGDAKAGLESTTKSTDAEGKACVDLAPISGSGSVIVRSEESDSGLAETVNVGLVSSFADVFDTSGDVDPPISGDTASSGTIFQATLVNGSNREFSVDETSLAFCSDSGSIDIATNVEGGDQVSGGGGIVVSVETDKERTSSGFAIALGLSDDSTGQSFAVRHQFRDEEVSCDPE